MVVICPSIYALQRCQSPGQQWCCSCNPCPDLYDFPDALQDVQKWYFNRKGPPPPAEVVKTLSLLGRMIPTIPNITDDQGRMRSNPAPAQTSKQFVDASSMLLRKNRMGARESCRMYR